MLPKASVATRWVKLVPIKLNIFSWRLIKDCLHTRLNLSKRGLDIPSLVCHMCDNGVESVNHLFFTCSVALALLEKVSRWWGINCLILFFS